MPARPYPPPPVNSAISEHMQCCTYDPVPRLIPAAPGTVGRPAADRNETVSATNMRRRRSPSAQRRCRNRGPSLTAPCRSRRLRCGLRARAVVAVRSDRGLGRFDRARVDIARVAARVLICSGQVQVSTLREAIVAADRHLMVVRRGVATRMRIAVAEAEQQRRVQPVVYEALAGVVLLCAPKGRVGVRSILRVAVAEAKDWAADRGWRRLVQDLCATFAKRCASSFFRRLKT